MPNIQFVALELLDRASRLEYSFSDLVSNGAAYSDDSNPCLADRCGYRSDSVFIQKIIRHDSKARGESGYWLLGAGYWVLDSEPRTLNPES